MGHQGPMSLSVTPVMATQEAPGRLTLNIGCDQNVKPQRSIEVARRTCSPKGSWGRERASPVLRKEPSEGLGRLKAQNWGDSNPPQCVSLPTWGSPRPQSQCETP